MKKILPILVLFFLLNTAAFSFANPVKKKYEEATEAFKKREFKEAITLFQETLDLYPSFPQPYNFMALAHKEIGSDPAEIIRLLNKAVEVDPHFAMAYDNLGKIHYEIGEFRKAKTHAQKSVELNPDSVTARLGLAWICLLGLGEMREAIEHFEIAVAKEKTDYGLFGLGMAYFMDHQRGRVLEMITSLRQEGRDNLATNLEDVIREGRYLPTKGVESLIESQNSRMRGTLAKDKPYAPPNINYPVRLSGKLDRGYPATVQQQAIGRQPYPYQGTMTGAQRIRQMQQNYQQKGSQY